LTLAKIRRFSARLGLIRRRWFSSPADSGKKSISRAWLITLSLSFDSSSLKRGFSLCRGSRSYFLVHGEMSGMQEQFEIKFRLPDGTDIGPKQYKK
jgi:hypothetical protein